MSQTVEVAKPDLSPIWASVSPVARRSLILVAQVTTPESLRLSVGQCQRHSVTGIRENQLMTIGERIKKRREDCRMSVRTLARKAEIAPTTLYDLERGDSRSTTKLHLIADVLGVTTRYLETGKEPKEATAEPVPIEGWPFQFDKSLFDALTPKQQLHIELMLEQTIALLSIDGRARHSKRQIGRSTFAQ